MKNHTEIYNNISKLEPFAVAINNLKKIIALMKLKNEEVD